MGVKLLPVPEADQELSRVFSVRDDFDTYVDAAAFTKLASDSGASVAATDAANGVLALTTGGTDNNEAMVKSTKKVYKFQDGKPLFGRFKAQYSEANTDDANLFVGFSSAAAANLMVDDGAGPAANHSAAGFFKKDGDTLWSVHISLGTSQTNVQLTAANSLDKVAKTAGGASYQDLVIEVQPLNSTQAEVRFFIDDTLVQKLTLTYTSAAVMNAVAYVKAGGANSEVLNLDFVSLRQLR